MWILRAGVFWVFVVFFAASGFFGGLCRYALICCVVFCYVFEWFVGVLFAGWLFVFMVSVCLGLAVGLTLLGLA